MCNLFCIFLAALLVFICTLTNGMAVVLVLIRPIVNLVVTGSKFSYRLHQNDLLLGEGFAQQDWSE